MYSSSNKVISLLDISSLESIHQHVAQIEEKGTSQDVDVNNQGCNLEDFYLICNGGRLTRTEQLSSSSVISSNFRLCGGKGGFGSMLRAIGARIEKTTNHEACRDLSGRRMRDVNNEKHIAEWLKEKEEKKEEREKKKQEKIDRLLNPKVNYVDKDYTTNLQQNADNIDEALKHALKNRKEKIGEKRKDTSSTDPNKNGKKSKISWLGMDEDMIDDDEEEEKEEDKSNSKDGNLKANEEKVDETIDIVKTHGDDSSGDASSTIDTVDHTVREESPASEDNTKNQSNNANKDPQIKPTTIALQVANRYGDPQEKCDFPLETGAISKYLHQSGTSHTCIPELLDLSDYQSPEQLEAVGLERLKSALMYHGMKCGGTLQDRAKRLFLTKSTPINELDPSLFAKKKKQKK